ncbi:MAG: hypothetical protein IIC50_11785 [Planctomycetes bacterium]|nr:hypothetical protein [Planctomycetota bacterium]
MTNRFPHPNEAEEGCVERADDRRDFLRKAAALSVGAVALAGAAQKRETTIPDGPKVDAGAMPMIRLGNTSVSRLILGANPMWGYSHRGKLLSRLMTDWYSGDRVVEVLHHAEARGINTWQSSVSGRLVDDWMRYRNEGGRMNLIILSAPGNNRPGDDLSTMKKLGALAVVHHGQWTDRYWRENRVDEVKVYLQRIREGGFLVGCSTHNPETLKYMEDHHWDLDFYMTSFYRVSKRRHQWKEELGWEPQHELYPQGMPDEMTAMIRQIPKPCLSYKVLAAGRICDRQEQVEAAFKYAFNNIKPTDGIIIGMFPKFEDQVAINANHTIKYG